MTTQRIIATLTCIPGKRQALLEALTPHITESRKEPGNISFEAYEDTTTPDTIVLVEDWRSMQDIKEHNTTPHYLAYKAKVASILESSNVSIVSPLQV